MSTPSASEQPVILSEPITLGSQLQLWLAFIVIHAFCVGRIQPTSTHNTTPMTRWPTRTLFQNFDPVGQIAVNHPMTILVHATNRLSSALHTFKDFPECQHFISSSSFILSILQERRHFIDCIEIDKLYQVHRNTEQTFGEEPKPRGATPALALAATCS